MLTVGVGVSCTAPSVHTSTPRLLVLKDQRLQGFVLQILDQSLNEPCLHQVCEARFGQCLLKPDILKSNKPPLDRLDPWPYWTLPVWTHRRHVGMDTYPVLFMSNSLKIRFASGIPCALGCLGHNDHNGDVHWTKQEHILSYIHD